VEKNNTRESSKVWKVGLESCPYSWCLEISGRRTLGVREPEYDDYLTKGNTIRKNIDLRGRVFIIDIHKENNSAQTIRNET